MCSSLKFPKETGKWSRYDRKRTSVPLAVFQKKQKESAIIVIMK
jgi:hypothetical protein